MPQIAGPRHNRRARKDYAKVRTKLFSVGDCVLLADDQKTHRGIVCKIREYRGQCEYAVPMMQPAADSTVESFVSGNYSGHKIPSSLSALPTSASLMRPPGPGALDRQCTDFVHCLQVPIQGLQFACPSSRTLSSISC
jgi:hypothetical protein